LSFYRTVVLLTTAFQSKKLMLSTQGAYMFFRLILDEQLVCPCQISRSATWHMLWRQATGL